MSETIKINKRNLIADTINISKNQSNISKSDDWKAFSRAANELSQAA